MKSTSYQYFFPSLPGDVFLPCDLGLVLLQRLMFEFNRSNQVYGCRTWTLRQENFSKFLTYTPPDRAVKARTTITPFLSSTSPSYTKPSVKSKGALGTDSYYSGPKSKAY